MEGTLYRRDSATTPMRSYAISVEEYDRLVAAGLDPETVAEEELARCALYCCDYEESKGGRTR